VACSTPTTLPSSCQQPTLLAQKPLGSGRPMAVPGTSTTHLACTDGQQNHIPPTPGGAALLLGTARGHSGPKRQAAGLSQAAGIAVAVP
jgi:hypothetical protein